jgi:ribonuclease HII
LKQVRLFDMPGGLVAGVDEAGRGPLAGPVVAAAVILDPGNPVDGVADSKTLSASRRATLARLIGERSLSWAVGWADAAEIDRINILQATFLAMRRAILGLHIQPARVRVDGNRLPNLLIGGRQIDGEAIIGGDASVVEISAASIVAKHYRDQMMVRFDALYPDYGFRRHKGYGTEAHREMLDRLGPCPQHRRSFRPVSRT